MKKLFLFLIFAAIAGSISAQTRELFRKSIGGATEFNEAKGADFGLPHDYMEQVRRVDSLIYLSETLSVKVTATYRKSSLRPGNTPRPIQVSRDTFYRHPLYTRKHALDSIRRELQATDGEATRDTKFIGYDSLREKKAGRPVSFAHPKKAAAVLAIAGTGKPVPPAGGAPLFAALTLVFGMTLCAGIARIFRSSILLR